MAKDFIWTTFSIFRFFFLHPQIPDLQIVVSQPNITSIEAYLFSFQMMHKSQFKKIDPYDCFCAPGVTFSK